MARRLTGGLAALALAWAAAGPALAQEAMRWQQREGDGRLLLAYEVPDTGDQSLLLSCETGSRRFALRYQDDRDRVRDGGTATVELASEGGRLSLPMRAEKQELGDQIVLVAATPLTASLVRLLSAETLRVTLEGVTERIPLAGARSGIGRLAAGCAAP